MSITLKMTFIYKRANISRQTKHKDKQHYNDIKELEYLLKAFREN